LKSEVFFSFSSQFSTNKPIDVGTEPKNDVFGIVLSTLRLSITFRLKKSAITAAATRGAAKQMIATLIYLNQNWHLKFD